MHLLCLFNHFKGLSILFQTSTRPYSLPSILPNAACPSSISIYPFLVTISTHSLTTKIKIPTPTSITNQHTNPNARTPYLYTCSFVSAVYALTIWRWWFQMQSSRNEQFFLSSGYPDNIVKNVLTKVFDISSHHPFYKQRNNQSTNRIPLDLISHPLYRQARKIIIQNYKALLWHKIFNIEYFLFSEHFIFPDQCGSQFTWFAWVERGLKAHWKEAPGAKFCDVTNMTRFLHASWFTDLFWARGGALHFSFNFDAQAKLR